MFAFGTFSTHKALTLRRSKVPLWHTRVGKGLRVLNKGLKYPLTIKYISMTLSGMSKSSEK